MIRRSLLRMLSLDSPKPPSRPLRLLTRHHRSHPPPRPHPSHTPIFFQTTPPVRLLSSSPADDTKAGGEDGDVREKSVSPFPAPERLLLRQQSGQTVEHLECGSCSVYLVGVRPRDGKSSQVVKDIINHLKPEVVFLESCEHRQVVVQKQQDVKIEVKNSVFHVAFKVAAQNGTKVILGDQPFHITVRRILEGMLAMRLWEFTKLSFYLLIWFMEYGKVCAYLSSVLYEDSSIRELEPSMPSPMQFDGDDGWKVTMRCFKENKVFNINGFVHKKLEELKTFPTLVQPAIHERDLYMSSVLTKIAKEHSLVVAVVGLDHIVGIKKHLEQSVEIGTDLSKKNG